MDAARAAAMSDPERNRWFRRRWLEPEGVKPRPVGDASPSDQLEKTGLDLLLTWRRQKAEERVR